MKTLKTYGCLLGLLLIGACISVQAEDRAHYSYDETSALITHLRTNRIDLVTTALNMQEVVYGLIDQSDWYSQDSLKYQLLHTSATRLRAEVNASDPLERELVRLLNYTRHTVGGFVTDRGLKSSVDKHGYYIKKRVSEQFGQKIVKSRLVVLEYYPPSEAARLVSLISVPHLTATTWAGDSKSGIYYLVRAREIAKRSLVAKLLLENGFLSIPDTVYAEYRYSGWKPTPIDLRFTRWSPDDIDGLTRLLSNPYYTKLAQRQLDAMKPLPL
jgi:hypothetical protein